MAHTLQQQKLWLYSIGTLAVLYAFWLFNPAGFYFLNDDLVHIPLSKDGVLFQRNSFRPVCDLSIRLDYLLWGKNAWGYHFSNLILHLISSLLLFITARILAARYYAKANKSLFAFMVASLFFIYAFHSESVFWILGRSATLGTIFLLSSLICYLYKNKSVAFFIASIILFCIGLLTYESIWVLPAIVSVIMVFDRSNEKWNDHNGKYLLYMMSVFSIYLFARYATLGEIVGAYEGSNLIDVNLIVLAGNYVRLLLRCFIPSFDNTAYFIAAAIVFVITAVILLAKKGALKQSRLFVMNLIFFLISILPYVSLGINTHQVEGERFLYLPSAFACVALITILFAVFQKRSAVVAAFVSLVLYHLFFLYRSHTYYSTASTITKITYEQINLLKGKQRLIIDSLPQSTNGALTFRLGFEEGLDWLKNSGTVDSVIIASLQTNSNDWSDNYSSSIKLLKEEKIFSSVLTRIPKGQQGYVERKNVSVTLKPQSDAYFIFSQNALEVYK